MPDLRKHSNTSNIVRFKLTKSTDGTAFTGLTSSSSGLIISIISDVEDTATAYTQAGSTIETITTLGTFATPTSGKCRFKEIDATNHPGLYEFQFADARFAVSSARRVVISVSGVTSLFSSDYEIELVQFDLFDAVRLGLTAMPNVAAGANGGLPLGDANGRVGLQAGTSAGQLDFTSGVVKANLAQILGTALTETAGQIAAAFKQFFDVASPTGTMKYISRVALVDTTTTNTDMRGTDNAATAAEMAKVPKSDSNVSFNATALAAIAAKVEASILDEGDATALLAAIAAKVEEFLINEGDATATIAAIATACNAAIAAGTVGSNVTAIKAKTDNLPSDPADQSAVEAAIAAAKFDPETALVETGVTYKQALQRIGATTAGKASGAGSGTETFKGLDGTTDRVEATVDNDGNRTGVTYDP